MTDARIEALEQSLRQLLAATKSTRDELSRWGMGDMHYGNTPQEPRVVLAVAVADAALEAARVLVSDVSTEDATHIDEENVLEEDPEMAWLLAEEAEIERRLEAPDVSTQETTDG